MLGRAPPSEEGAALEPTLVNGWVQELSAAEEAGKPQRHHIFQITNYLAVFHPGLAHFAQKLKARGELRTGKSVQGELTWSSTHA